MVYLFAKREKENPAPRGKTGLMKGGVVPPGIEPDRANERRSGTSRNRTGDTRIFSPMLYQLS